MKQKAKINDTVVLNQKALRRYRDRFKDKTGKVIDTRYEFYLERLVYTVSFAGYDDIQIWSYEFDKVK